MISISLALGRINFQKTPSSQYNHCYQKLQDKLWLLCSFLQCLVQLVNSLVSLWMRGKCWQKFGSSMEKKSKKFIYKFYRYNLSYPTANSILKRTINWCFTVTGTHLRLRTKEESWFILLRQQSITISVKENRWRRASWVHDTASRKRFISSRDFMQKALKCLNYFFNYFLEKKGRKIGRQLCPV